jgi:hypothetical protein
MLGGKEIQNKTFIIRSKIMSAITKLSNLSGKWHGTNQLWLSPEEPVHESESIAEISTITQGQFMEIQYSWTYEGKAQEGRIILGQTPEGESFLAVEISYSRHR